MTQKLAILEEVTDLRTVWPHEALDFTPWLAENLQLLSDTIGVDIVLDERESDVGSFSVDIYGYESDTDRKVIIENQPEDTNHDHLGKLITYAAGKSAGIVIWLVKRARDEHRAAIEWLNSHTDDSVSFFLCEIKLYRIGDSDPAVKFELIESPNSWLKESSAPSIQGAGKQTRFAFWSAFIDYAFDNTPFAQEFGKRKPSTYNWLAFYIGVGSAHINLIQAHTRSTLGVSLIINEDKDMFNYLFQRKADIEGELGFALAWNGAQDKKMSTARIEHVTQYSEPDEWRETFDWAIETAIKMKKVFKRHITQFQEAVDAVDESLYDPEK